MALNKETFRTRSISAAVFVIVLLSAVYFNYWIATLFFSSIAFICFHEFGKLSEKLGAPVFKITGNLLGILTLLLLISVELRLARLGVVMFGGLAMSGVIVGTTALFSKTEKPFLSACFTLFGVVYCFLPFLLLLLIPLNGQIIKTTGTYQPLSILGLIFLIWANDTFAYIGGSLMGKNKMYERVSPGKTWEGTLIGVLCCIGVGFVLNVFGIYESVWIWPAIAALVAIFGTIGDLIESLLKRQAGVKDSGTLMPGHGGALDRFDSLIVAAPVVSMFLFLISELH